MTETAEIQIDLQKVPEKISGLRWNSLRKRMGRFRIAEEMLVNNVAAVQAIMGECIVTRCDHRWDTNIFEYDALSFQFREVPQGEMSPEYVWEKDKGGKWTAKEETK